MKTHCVESRVVDTAAGILNTIINKRPSIVHWITVSTEAQGGVGVIEIYDGFDREGDLKWRLEPGYSRHHNFIPPFSCKVGIFIYNDAAIASYTIGYCVEYRAPFDRLPVEGA